MRLMLTGETIVYEPDELVLHDHPDTMHALKREVFGYGSGLTSAAMRILVRGPRRRRLIASLFSGIKFAISPRHKKNSRKGSKFPVDLTLREVAGMAYGPIGCFSCTTANFAR